ncbi:hypothetical protein Sme01_62970 [Sphaerisporangium melleum]|uniref:Uncharacterized protein n=1 Tax=Sphaerisporangium melleum TaxID=321316 RepID=A0A917R0P4_9ACTN|nr:hypothetical protein GCM10007964_25380 [Sphaerisporangium melleum]GII73821.1 hypothetical protein Sme01_62970 [Sphaerisporangium melleum]
MLALLVSRRAVCAAPVLPAVASALPVLMGLTVTSSGGSVLAGVDSGRDRAAVTSVGADARVQTFGACSSLTRPPFAM